MDISQQAFYRFRLHERPAAVEQSALFLANRLFQQYVIDAWVACETTRLDWINNYQKDIRADVFVGLGDAVGRKVILPSSFTGGDRYMQQLYQDSMAIVRQIGPPTFFITSTANPNWPEIKDYLRPGQQANDRPDLISRVFHLKVREMLHDVRQDMIFGPYNAHVYTIEYQKRGLSHMHLLLWIDVDASFWTPENIDEVICAQLPDPQTDPEMWSLVVTHMIHGPCGADNPASPCMKDGVCSKGFTKPFAEATTITEDHGVTLARPDNGRVCDKKVGSRTVQVDNRSVVAFNKKLMHKYRAHINIEFCVSYRSIQYLHKYVCKGNDRTTIEMQDRRDEVKQYIKARKLMGFFRWSPEHPETNYLYAEMPSNCVWVAQPRVWKQREKYLRNIGRMFHCSPVASERFYLRLLLTVVRGPKSFEELYHFEGRRYPTYREACIARGLADDDKEWVSCFDDAVRICLGRGLRTLFLSGLYLRLIADPLAIWNKYKDQFCDDLERRLDRRQSIPSNLREPNGDGLREPHIDYGLYLLAESLADQHLTLADFNLPSCVGNWGSTHLELSLSGAGNTDEDLDAVALELREKLNADQEAAFLATTNAVNDDPSTTHFYLQGPGGTGKTFLYRALYYHYRTQGKTVISVASTGIAALLLPGGRAYTPSSKYRSRSTRRRDAPSRSRAPVNSSLLPSRSSVCA
ncbi:uncharacterized protein CPUR_00024 [Claviceps purpurea 20.1]|uniref:ATP-dependent DNA helicase n=1 Tax=Claviceps purpurea (strain 20.1) TaxID=1111077 RepID=M1VXP2_CLAP2|nr:uncharacterized protein CPUR_00024 [Claviceps purpurea 20.1]